MAHILEGKSMATPTTVVGKIPAADQNGTTDPKAVEPERRPIKVLPTTRVGFAKQLQLLRAFAALAATDKAATTSGAAEIVGIHPSTAILANPFFIDVGFLQKVGTSIIPAPEVIAYHRAVEWNPETAPTKLAPLLRKTWFGAKLLPKLSLNTLDEGQAIELLAAESAASPKYAGQLGVILDYMAVAGLVRRDGGVIRSGASLPLEESPTKVEAPMQMTEEEPVRETRRAPSIATAFSQAPEGVLRFNVDVSVDMKEFATWQPDRISAFWAGIAQVLAAKAKVEAGGRKEQ
jgi:hypothetical protein